LESQEFAMELLANGKRILSLPTSEHVPTAVFELSAATEAFSELYGEGAVECSEAYFYYGKSLLAMSKIESVVLSNALAGIDIDTPDTTEGIVEDPEKCSKEERDELELKVAEALEENFEKHESIATAHIYGADEDVTDSEDESEGEDDSTEDDPEKEDEPSDLELAWEVLELAKNAYTKIHETCQGQKKVDAESILSDVYLALGEVSIEAENYPMAVKDLVVALGMKRTGPEDSRSLAETLYQLGVAQAYAGNVLESVVSLDNAIAVLVKRKKNLEKLGSSPGINLEVVDLDGLIKDIGNIVSEQKDMPKNQSGKMVTSLCVRTDPIVVARPLDITTGGSA